MTNTLISIDISYDTINTSFINEQGKLITIPDFDEPSNHYFPNSVIMSDSLFTVGVNASAIAQTRQSFSQDHFNWHSFQQEVISSSSSQEPYIQRELLFMLLSKVYRDTYLFLHHKALSCIFPIPENINKSCTLALKSIAKRVGFNNCLTVSRFYSLANSYELKTLPSKKISLLLDIATQQSTLGIFQTPLMEQPSNTLVENSRVENIETCSHSFFLTVYQHLTTLFSKEYVLEHITNKGKANLKKIAKRIINRFLANETTFSTTEIIDGFIFNVAMNQHHFSSLLFPFIDRLAQDVIKFINTNKPYLEHDYHIYIAGFIGNSALTHQRLNSQLGQKITFIKKNNNSYYNEGALQLSNHLTPSSTSMTDFFQECTIPNPGQKSIGVLGFDSERSQEALDTLFDETQNLGNATVIKRYTIKADENNLCYFPIAYPLPNNNFVEMGKVCINAQVQTDASISIELSVTSKDSQTLYFTAKDANSHQELESKWIANEEQFKEHNFERRVMY